VRQGSEEPLSSRQEHIRAQAGSHPRTLGPPPDPEGPSDNRRNASQLPRKPSVNRQPVSRPRRVCQRTSRTRPGFQRTHPRRSTGAYRNSEELLNTPSLRFRALAGPITRRQSNIKTPGSFSATHQPSGPRGTRQRTSDSPWNSEENLGELSERIRAPENSSTSVRLGAKLRRAF
jgi:hypothetical protein